MGWIAAGCQEQEGTLPTGFRLVGGDELHVVPDRDRFAGHGVVGLAERDDVPFLVRASGHLDMGTYRSALQARGLRAVPGQPLPAEVLPVREPASALARRVAVPLMLVTVMLRPLPPGLVRLSDGCPRVLVRTRLGDVAAGDRAAVTNGLLCFDCHFGPPDFGSSVLRYPSFARPAPGQTSLRQPAGEIKCPDANSWISGSESAAFPSVEFGTGRGRCIPGPSWVGGTQRQAVARAGSGLGALPGRHAETAYAVLAL
jgi:hypothetical protein